MEYKNLRVTNVNTRDYPDFADAYIEYGEDENGEPLTEEQLEKLNEDGDLVHNLAHESRY